MFIIVDAHVAIKTNSKRKNGILVCLVWPRDKNSIMNSNLNGHVG